MDPLGLFQFGKRPLNGVPNFLSSLTQAFDMFDANNTELMHEHGFYEDGSGDNVGFGPKGIMDTEEINKFKLEDKHYDDKIMRRAEDSVIAGEYKAVPDWNGPSNNCQDYAEKLRKRYRALE